MCILPAPWGMRPAFMVALLVIGMILAAPAGAQLQATGPEPAVYLNFDEGSGDFAMDNSGQGNGGTLHNISRIDGGGCSRAISFPNPDSYVAIPYRVRNHPEDAITVSAWFYIDNFTPAALISGYHDGGYRLGFDDGNDLWWTLNLESGDLSIPVQHENIALHRWHQVTGSYDGTTMKIYLDGILRNQVNATGRIHYRAQNYVMLGADAGPGDTPASCPPFFTGGLDEVRIYPVALTYNQVMDDRFRCLEGERAPPAVFRQPAPGTCGPVSGSVRLGANDSATRVLSFANRTLNGSWQVSVPPGSLLKVHAFDAYAKAAPDSWYLEIDDGSERLARTIAFPGRNNAPAEGLIRTGNGTVTVRYFSGGERFPAQVTLRLESVPGVQPPMLPQTPLLENPIIVIYSASWATVIAIILVMVWLHRRRKARKAAAAGKTEIPPCEEKKL